MSLFISLGYNGTIDGQGCYWWDKFHKGELKLTRPYKLQLPETAKIHPIFHGSLLKKAVEDYGVEESLPSELACDDATSLEPKAV